MLSVLLLSVPLHQLHYKYLDSRRCSHVTSAQQRRTVFRIRGAKNDHGAKILYVIYQHLASYTKILLTLGGGVGKMMYSPILFIIGWEIAPRIDAHASMHGLSNVILYYSADLTSFSISVHLWKCFFASLIMFIEAIISKIYYIVL